MASKAPKIPCLARRSLLLSAAAAPWLTSCATSSTPMDLPVVVFVHGNGDTAALWTTTLWRFESNGWPRGRLHAVDAPYPLARDDDAKPQPGRTSTTENMAFLAAEVADVLHRTGAARVALMANSRGGNAVRDFVARGGGGATVSHAILCGTPNHGVWADPARNPGSEFNGAGLFLSGLNTPQGSAGDEVPAGVRWLTIRSDANDKYAQPDGAWIGSRGTPTNVGFDGPALKGAENVVIAGIDHRETAFSAKAFEQAFRFVTGKPPLTLAVVPETHVVLDGKVSGYGVDNLRGSAPSNLPLAGATVEVHATDPATGLRRGSAAHRRTVGADGRWGPFDADGAATYEFVVTAPGYAATHVYRSPFPRSSAIVHLRAERIADADKAARAIVTLTRPRGYFGLPRDQISLDGASPPAGLAPGVAGLSTVKLQLADATDRAIAADFNGERIVGRVRPLADNAVVLLELHS